MLVANTSLGIVNSKVVMANGGNDAANADKTDKAEKYINAHSVGSGPYTLKSFSTSSQIVLTREPDVLGRRSRSSRRSSCATCCRATQLLDVQRGTNEIALDLSPDQAKTLGGSVKVAETPSPNVFFLFANSEPEGLGDQLEPAHPERDPLRDRLLGPRLDRGRGRGAGRRRRAVDVPRRAQAGLGRQDRPREGQGRGRGVGHQRTRRWISSTRRGFSSNGLDFGVLAQSVQSALAKVGITVNLKGSALTTSLATYRAGTEQIGLWYWGPDYPDPNDYLAFLPGATVGLRAGWAAGLERRPRGARQEGVGDGLGQAARRRASSRSRTP